MKIPIEGWRFIGALVLSTATATVLALNFLSSKIKEGTNEVLDEIDVENRLASLESRPEGLFFHTETVSVFTDRSVLQEELGHSFVVAEESRKNNFIYKTINLPPELSRHQLIAAFWSPSASLDQVSLFHRVNVRIDDENRLQMVAQRRRGAPGGILEARIHVLYRKGE